MAYRQVARRGVLGFELTPPQDVIVTPSGGGVMVAERRGGRTVGEIEIRPFQAALIIDRDGILEEKAQSVAAAAGAVVVAVPFALPGASGYRADVALRDTPLPYIHVLAIADEGGVDGGLLVIVRSASPEWPAADAILQSMRLVNGRGVVHANDGDLRLPVVGPTR
jgi:hypothetical protein